MQPVTSIRTEGCPYAVDFAIYVYIEFHLHFNGQNYPNKLF